MAETVEYIVRIVGLGGDDDEKKEKEKPSALTSGLEGLQKALHPIDNALKHKKNETENMFYIKEATKNAISVAETGIQLTLNRYFKLSEDYKSQNYLNNVMSNVNRAKGFASSTISGAVAGAKFGPVGAVFGALISGTANIGKQLIEWDNTLKNFYSSMNATRVETSFRARRAGLYDGGKGTEN